MRFGYTTGSCAAAAAKAAAIGLFTGNIPGEVEINTPAGVKLRLKVHHRQLSANEAACAVQKDAGDDPDVTNGCYIYAKIKRIFTQTIEIDGGEGVGRVTKPGLQVPVGHAAINPVPRRMIEGAVKEVIGNGCGLKIVISVPDGKALGEKTFNPKLGIIGGISIIGTTGIVRPMSEDAFKTSLLCGLDIAKGIGYETVVLVPGSLGERSILNLFNIPKDQVIQISNFVGFMLTAAGQRNFKRIILAGHPGKLAKLLRGDFQTHSTVSMPANDILIDIIEQHYCKQLTTPFSPPSQGGDFVVSAQSNDEGEVKTCKKKKFLGCNTKVQNGGQESGVRGQKTETRLPNAILNHLKEVSTIEGIVELLREYKYLSIMDEVAEKVETKVLEFYRDKQPFPTLEVGVILFDMKGSIIGISISAQTWLNVTKTKSS
ncbi:MAG: cobalt-precorrin-5B (C(1))-methyltransferase CbiD [Candidatus Brocadiaceae bacterium]|nr:cobalt-precorrin-5B (C(1))-methyltransferase CbiD [Candidatus Brocadiaceae bacterium]